MGDLKLNGATSGTITLTPTAVAGTNTITLPAVTGTLLTSATAVTAAQGGTGLTSSGVSGTVILSNGTTWITSVAPAFSAYVPTNQSISISTWTKMAASTEEFDTNSNYDAATNYRFTPTVAGYYQFNSCWQTTASCTIAIAIRKNGSAWKLGNFTTTASLGGPNATVSAMAYCNGSTDYVESYVISSAATAIIGDSNSCYFQGFFVRGA